MLVNGELFASWIVLTYKLLELAVIAFGFRNNEITPVDAPGPANQVNRCKKLEEAY